MVKELLNSILGKETEDDIPDELPSLADSANSAKKPSSVPDELPQIKVPSKSSSASLVLSSFKSLTAPVTSQASKPSTTPNSVTKPLGDTSKPIEKVIDSPNISKTVTLVKKEDTKDSNSKDYKDRSIIEREIELLQKEFSQPEEVKIVVQDAPNLEENKLKTTEINDIIVDNVHTDDMHFAMNSMAVKLQEQQSKPGFFSDFYKILKEQGYNDALLSQDLFNRMKNYHDIKPNETGTIFTGNEPELKENLLQKINELKELESKWQVQKSILEEDKKFLLQREEEIQTKISELKKVSNELKFHQNVTQTQYFKLKNGVVIKNVREMLEVLKVIDDETFNYHISNGRNDFYEWIKNIVKDESLAHKMLGKRDRNHLILTMEAEIKQEELNPKSNSLYNLLYNKENNKNKINSEKNNNSEQNTTNTKQNTEQTSSLMPSISQNKPQPILNSSKLNLRTSYKEPENPDHFFKLKNGQTVRNLTDLTKALQEISDEEFRFHVNNYKNDFAQWVRHIFKDEKLANYLEPIKTKQEMIHFLDVFL